MKARTIPQGRRACRALAAAASLAILSGCIGASDSARVAPAPTVAEGDEAPSPEPNKESPVAKSNEEWKKALTPMQYRVTREKGTEPPFRNEYWDEKRSGVYECVCCGQPLFHSQTKYDSGTGWPSFYAPLDEAGVRTEEDRHLFFQVRTEVLCSRCDAHLGHVFPDGPPPTGMRYCMNSAALRLRPDEQAKGEGEASERGADE